MPDFWVLAVAIGTLIVSAASSGALVALSLPALQKLMLVRPNIRSSHQTPTPQGGGIAVVIATLATTWGAVWMLGGLPKAEVGLLLALTGSVILLAVTGAIDDFHPLGPMPRLAVQCVAVGVVITMLPENLRVEPTLPLHLERAGLFVGGVWLVNLVNFMDGVDLMTVAEAVPITSAIALIGFMGVVSVAPLLVTLALLGALLGFAPYNRPAARVFLGDVGSLPIGLMLGWLLLILAARGHVAAAILLPLYYLADATLTLLRRTWQRQPIWRAHRCHFYQQAVDRGLGVRRVVGLVFATNLSLAALALISIVGNSLLISATCLAVGVILVGRLLFYFAHGRKQT